MTLFKLSLKNIQKSIKDYAIYFFTLILGVSIFYVFNAIESQTILFDITSSKYEIIELMTRIMSGVSVFVSFILGFLVVYASRFLMKRRKKEFGIYLTLGMSKRKISTILLFETIIIGVISLVVGLGIGTVLSQAMSVVVANMFEADLTKFAFVFSKSACVKSLIYFSIIYIIVMMFNTFSVSKCKLIDLINANRKEEKIKLKNPLFCTIIFAVSCCVLGYAYWMVIGNFDSLTNESITIAIALGCVSTFFIFWSLSGLLLRIFMTLKGTYFKGLNSFTLRQFSSKINTTVFSTTVICLMLFLTICILSSGLSIKRSLNKNINELAPADVVMEYDIQSRNIKDELYKNGFDVKKEFSEYVEFETFSLDNYFTFKYTLGDSFDEIKKQYPFLADDRDMSEELIKISEYNKLAKLYGHKQYSLKDDEYMVICDYDNMEMIRNIPLENGQKLQVEDKILKPKYKRCKMGFIRISGVHSNAGIFIVPDSLKISKENAEIVKSFAANYSAKKREEKEKSEKNHLKAKDGIMNNQDKNEACTFSTSTKLEIVSSSVGLGALVTFVGLYLGIIFLISSAAILALKELSESTDNKERYAMIRKLGADEKMINRSLFRQIGIFFSFPLILAIIHSVVGIKFCTILLSTFGSEEKLSSVGLTALFIIIIYGGYFLITYFSSKNIIREK